MFCKNTIYFLSEELLAKEKKRRNSHIFLKSHFYVFTFLCVGLKSVKYEIVNSLRLGRDFCVIFREHLFREFI